MSPSDSRSQPACGYVFPHPVDGSPAAETGLPGSLTDLSTRAVPYHPGKPDECSLPLLPRRLQASSSLADWPLPLCVTRPNRVRLRYGSGVRFPELHRTDCSATAPGSLSAERVIRRVNSFQFTRSVRLGLAHQRTRRKRGKSETRRHEDTKRREARQEHVCASSVSTVSSVVLHLSPRPSMRFVKSCLLLV